MAYGDKWESKVILQLTITASSKDRAQRKWDQTLEKIKYQVSGLDITETIEPYWVKLEEDVVTD